jgi:hypothetical protein
MRGSSITQPQPGKLASDLLPVHEAAAPTLRFTFYVWYEGPSQNLLDMDQDTIIEDINGGLAKGREADPPPTDFKNRYSAGGQCATDTCDAVKIVIELDREMLVPTVSWHEGSGPATNNDENHPKTILPGCNPSLQPDAAKICKGQLTDHIVKLLAQHKHRNRGP